MGKYRENTFNCFFYSYYFTSVSISSPCRRDQFAVFISCKLMFILQEILWADLHSLSIHGPFLFAFLLHFSVLDTINILFVTVQ